MPGALGKSFDQATDGENNAVELDLGYPLRRGLDAAIRELRERYGDALRLLPMSGTSGAGGVFQAPKPPACTVVGLRLDAPATPRIHSDEVADPAALELDEIVIDEARQAVGAGAAITLDQLSRALGDRLGPGYRVPGADLTSYQYAAVGATFMTGGMGPQRRYFSDSVDAIALHDGERFATIEGDAVADFAGTYGWSGIVGALRCRYYRFPANEIAFALPVDDEPASLARLLAHLAAHAWLDLGGEVVRSAAGDGALILGLEHVSRASMRPLLDVADSNPAGPRARDLERKLEAAGADGLIFVSGLADGSIDDFLGALLDESDGERFTLAGIDLEHAEIFNDPEEMRAVREAIPYAARMQRPCGRHLYKNHSDADIRLPPASVEAKMTRLWQINRDYVAVVDAYFREQTDIDGEILVYGHLNPFGVDPHNRVTMCADDPDRFAAAREFLIARRADYYRALAGLCADGDAIFVGGEKTADSELGIYHALGGPDNAPPALRERFYRQRERIRAAAPLFNWRAPEPFA